MIESFGKLDNRLIFISDGSTCIKNLIEDAFPAAIFVLDYYHVWEYHEFRNGFLKDLAFGQKWTSQQKGLILSSQVPEVLKNIKAIAPTNEEDNKLIAYYESNKDRMDYQKYKQLGCGIIESGAIKSAHRSVIQKRMKLSWQRWSKQGAQNMLNHRVINKNHQWFKIIEISRYGFKATG